MSVSDVLLGDTRMIPARSTLSTVYVNITSLNPRTMYTLQLQAKHDSGEVVELSVRVGVKTRPENRYK